MLRPLSNNIYVLLVLDVLYGRNTFLICVLLIIKFNRFESVLRLINIFLYVLLTILYEYP